MDLAVGIDEESTNPQKIEDGRVDERKNPPKMEGMREGGAGHGKSAGIHR